MFARICVLLLAAVHTADAQYSTGPHGAPISLPAPDGENPCVRTWYDPDIFVMPDGDLGLLAQASSPNICTEIPVDAFQPAFRNSVNGEWTTPALIGSVNSCPALHGNYTRCGFEPGWRAGPIASPAVVRLENPESPTGVRYYMAFGGGNADFIHGKIYWAVSDDGRSWTVYARNATEYWAPVIQAKYMRSASSPRSAPACEQPSGIGQVQLAFENGLFYVFLQYWHPVQPECADHTSAQCVSSGFQVYDRALSSVLLRFDYNPKHPFGFGPSVREIYLDGAWQRHQTFKLVWRYDVDGQGTQLPADPSSPVLDLFNGVQTAGFGFGAGDVEHGNGRWLHVYEFEGVTRAQTATSVDPTLSRWSAPEIVDIASLARDFPLATNDIASGIWYGSLSGSAPKWWIWAPIAQSQTRCGSLEKPNFFAALALVPAVLCTPDAPCE